MKTTKMMLEYIASCSKASLQSFELARLNDRANLRKQMIEILDQLIEVDVQSRIAEWVLVQRQREEQMHDQGGAMRRPPQQALRGAALPSASEPHQLNAEATSPTDTPDDILRHPMMVTLREVLPDGAVRHGKPSAPSMAVPAFNIAAKSKRIA